MRAIIFLYLVKSLNADEESDVYGYEVLSLPNVTEEEFKALAHHYRRPCPLKVVAAILFVLFILFGLSATFFAFFENLQNSQTGEIQLSMAFAVSYMYAGGFVTVALGLLLLVLKKDKKCCKK